MNERTFNAIRSCEQSAAILARKYGWDAPHFYLPHGDTEIELWRAVEALSTFLGKLVQLDESSTVPILPSVTESVLFTDVPGINDEIQMTLYNAGYLTWEDILQAGVLTLRDNIAGVGMRRARALFERAQMEA